jgi:hypothetical protein
MFGYDTTTAAPHYVDDGTSVMVFDDSTLAWHGETIDDDPTFHHPSPREGASAVYDYQDDSDHGTTPQRGPCIVVFGGRTGAHCYNETWRLNLVRNSSAHWQWQQIGPGCTTGDCLSQQPTPARDRAAIAIDTFDRHRITVYGGEDSAHVTLGDIWQLPVNYYSVDSDHRDQWLPITSTGLTAARAGHKMVFDPNGWESRHLELYNPLTGTWSTPSGTTRWLSAYPAVYQQPEDGKVFYATGGGMHSRYYDLGAHSWSAGSVQDASALGDTIPSSATAVMFRPGQIMRCGGFANGQALYQTETLDLTSGGNGTNLPSTWSYDISKNLPANQSRYHHNLVSLPDGNVLLVGGTDGPTAVGLDLAHARRDAYLWSPDPTSASGAWTQMATDSMPRGYHSTAVLLPDARVLASGGQAVDFNVGVDPGADSAEIYTPGYLYDSNDNAIQLSSRPQITSAPTAITYASDPDSFVLGVSVPSNHSVAKVCMIRTGAVTHSVAMDQRYIPLRFTQSGNQLTVWKETVPYGALHSFATGYIFADPVNGPNIAPPGWYMLFVVDNTGVPSVAWWIKIDPVAPSVIQLYATGECPSEILLWWNAPGDDKDVGAAAAYDLRSSTQTITDANFGSATQISTGTPQHAGTTEQVTIAASCTVGQYFAIKARDAANNWSALSNVPYAVGTCASPHHGCLGERLVPVPPDPSRVPTAVELSAPVPNPTTGTATTELRFGVPVNRAGESYELSVFDLAGRRIVTLSHGVAVPGYHSVNWDLRSQQGGRVGKGIYFVRLRLDSSALTQRVIVVR